jgi:integrase/recombinase XerC
MQVLEALEAFLLQLEADGRSPHTVAQYRRHVRAFAAWAQDAQIETLRPDDLARFFGAAAARARPDGAAKKATSLNALRTSLRCFFAYLHEAGLVTANPTRLLRRARCAPPPPRALKDDEVQRLLAALAAGEGEEAARDRMLVELLLGTGLRLGAAISLDVEDLDLAHGELHVRRQKNDRPATVLVPASVAERLRPFVGDRESGPVFLARGERVSKRHAQRRLAGWLAGAGITRKASAHSLRHSYATALLAKTGDLGLVQQALHHRSIVSTTVYAQTDEARLRAVLRA